MVWKNIPINGFVGLKDSSEVLLFPLHDGLYPMTVDLVSFSWYMSVLPLT